MDGKEDAAVEPVVVALVVGGAAGSFAEGGLRMTTFWVGAED